MGSQPKRSEELTKEEQEAQRLLALQQLTAMNEKEIVSLEPYLPLLFQLNGNPYTLEDHFAWSAMFRTRLPFARVCKCARQTAKSTYLSTHGLLLTSLHAHFNQLFLTPLYEQCRRLSSNYFEPLIAESQIKHLLVDSSCNQSVLQRNFLNRSSMYFSYAYLSAARIRGLSRIMRVAIDESVCGTTSHVETPNGHKLVKDVVFGELVKSFDYNGNIVWQPVSNVWYAGRRRCYRLKTSKGKYIDVTSDTPMATNAGWLRVSEIIETVVATARDRSNETVIAAPEISSARDIAGRRMLTSVRFLLGHTRTTAERVSLDPAQHLVRIRSWESFANTEAQCKRRVSQILDCSNSGIQILACPGISERYQNSDSGMVTDDRRDRVPTHDSLVGSRRWHASRSDVFTDHDIVYPRLSTLRGRTFVPMADGSWVSCVSLHAQDTESPALSACKIYSASIYSINARSCTLDPDLYALQTRSYRKRGPGYVHVLPNTLYPTKFNSSYRSTKFSMLSSQKLPRAATNVVLPKTADTAQEDNKKNLSVNATLLDETLIEIEDMGVHDVYDITVESTHTVAINGLAAKNCQDFDQTHIPIVFETMSASPAPWGIIDYTGTPKGYDNPVQQYWEASSQAEWIIRCKQPGCGKWNMCSADADLYKMLGPVHDNIGPRRDGMAPGTVCAKCQKPIDPRTGYWYHRYSDRRWDFAGYHIPQPIMPMHCESRRKWAVLKAKQDGGYNFTPCTFNNEVLAESFDTGSKLLTLNELRSACTLGFTNNTRDINPQAFENRDAYRKTVLGIDWGGGGGDGLPSHSEAARRRRISFTTVAFMGIKFDNVIDVLWGTRLLTPNDHSLEAKQILSFIRALHPNFIAHDVNGAGSLRQTLLMQAGVPGQLFAGFDYKHIPSGKIIQFIPPSGGGQSHFRVDKTRTLQTTINAIKFGHVRFFNYDYHDQESPGLLRDFLALTEEKVETLTADRYVIRRIASMPDDFAHSVNVGCCALWHSTSSWPDYVADARTSPDYFNDSKDDDYD